MSKYMAKNCRLVPAADLMTEIINYEIRVEEQRRQIIELKAELAKRDRELANLRAAVNEYMAAESALGPPCKRRRTSPAKK